jgi:hypothetical protein
VISIQWKQIDGGGALNARDIPDTPQNFVEVRCPLFRRRTVFVRIDSSFAEVDPDTYRNHGVAGILDSAANEMVASGSTQRHAPDYPNHTPGADPGVLQNKPT